jgi:hypothetical protein
VSGHIAAGDSPFSRMHSYVKEQPVGPEKAETGPYMLIAMKISDKMDVKWLVFECVVGGVMSST